MKVEITIATRLSGIDVTKIIIDGEAEFIEALLKTIKETATKNYLMIK